MNNAKEIKRRLLYEPDRIFKVLEELGCDYVKNEQRGKLITARLPEKFGSQNKRSVQVYTNDSLTCKIRSREDFKGDIFSLVAYLKYDKSGDEAQKYFVESFKFISDLFGWSFDNKTKPKKDYVAPLKKLASQSRTYEIRVPNEPIKEKKLNNFIKASCKQWIEEGISCETQEFYGIGFDLSTHRISIPIRNEKNELVGVKGRLLLNQDISDFEPKYKYIYNCNISQEWFNMNNAMEHILAEKRVYILEAEKSVMKLHSNGIYNAVAISSSDISPVQAQMIRALGVDIEIILCYDKDKGVDTYKIQADKFKDRNVFGVIDINNLLGEKDSPIDKGIEVWNTLINENCYEINVV